MSSRAPAATGPARQRRCVIVGRAEASSRFCGNFSAADQTGADGREAPTTMASALPKRPAARRRLLLWHGCKISDVQRCGFFSADGREFDPAFYFSLAVRVRL